MGASHPEIAEVPLFGSLARGTRNPYADADILIVLDASDLRPRDRIPRYKPVGAPVPIDLTVCTRAELDREMRAGNPFLRTILADAVALYERPGGSAPQSPEPTSDAS
jgi:hypothetical protein